MEKWLHIPASGLEKLAIESAKPTPEVLVYDKIK